MIIMWEISFLRHLVTYCQRLMHAVGRQYRRYNHLIIDLLGRFEEQRRNIGPRLVHGELRPNVLRVHEPNGADQDSGSHSATLLDYPVCDVTLQQNCTRLGLTSILQSSDGGIDTGKAISQYSSRTQPGRKSDAVLMIPNMWAIILGSEVIVTYSHLDFDDLCDTNIEISAPSDTPTTVKIEDLQRNLHFFALSTCRSYYALRSLVVRECRPDVHSTDLLEILFEDGIKVTAENWLISISRCQASIIPLVLAFNDRAKGTHHADSLPNTGPTNSSMSTSYHTHPANRSGQHATTLSSARSTAYSNHTITRDSPKILGRVESRTMASGNISEAQQDNIETKIKPTKVIPEGDRSMADLLGLVPKPFFLHTSSQNDFGLIHNLSRLEEDLRYSKLYRKGFERTLEELRQNARNLPGHLLDCIPHGLGQDPPGTYQKSPYNMTDGTDDPARYTRRHQFRARLLTAATVFYLHFLPEDLDHVISWKYWGAVDTISTVSPCSNIRYI